MNIDWKDKLAAIADEHPELNRVPDDLPEPAPEPAPEPQPRAPKQTLRVELDKRKGKTATLITGYDAPDEEVKKLAQTLKIKLATGGSTRDDEILIQGDVRRKAAELLEGLGFKVKRINF